VILHPPGSVVQFVDRYLSSAPILTPSHIRRALTSIITTVALSAGKRLSQTSMGRQIFSRQRHKSTTSRMMRDRRFKTRELLWSAVKKALRELKPRDGEVVEWLLALDGTALQRGADTRIKGAIQAERKEPAKKKGASSQRRRADGVSKKKGRRTKYHTFLVGSLTTHTGVRIPLGRYTCDPKRFNRRGRPRKMRTTQLDLARLLIERALSILPKNVRVRVVADSYFECEKLFTLAGRRDFVLITPTDSNRCFADEATPHKSNGLCIRDYGLDLSKDSFTRLDLYRGSEKTACFRRHVARKAGPKDRRTYRLCHERRTVARLGTVGVVYSWKTPVFEPRRNFKKKSFKVLLCSDPTWTGERVVEWYECRWTAIEILIRELKGQLGLDHYTGQNLEALERHIDLVLLGFLYLEMERHRLIEDAKTPPTIRELAVGSRTHGMQDLVKWEAGQMLRQAILTSYGSERTRRRLKRFFREVHSTLDVSSHRRAA
jgi:hypothetical protein